MYSWQQFTDDAAIILGGGIEGRKKASEILNNQKFQVIAGSTVLGIVLIYSIRKIYLRSRSKPEQRRSRLSAHDLRQTERGPGISKLSHAVQNLEKMSDSVTESSMEKTAENFTHAESSNTVPNKVLDSEALPMNGLPDQISGESGDAKPSLKTDETEISGTTSNQNSPRHLENPANQKNIVENGHDITLDSTAKKRDPVLNEKLQKYYDSYVQISDGHLSIIRTIAEDFKYMFEHCCEELLPNHNLQGLSTAGSTSAHLQVVKPDGVDIYVNLALDPALWALVDAGQSVMSAHGYWLIKRQQAEFFSHGTSKYDKYLVADYLSPNRILSAFLDMINRVAKWSDEYKVQAEVVGPSVTLKVFYHDNLQKKQTVVLDFIPCVSIGDVTVVAKFHPVAEEDASFANLWRQSFEEEENKCIFAENPQGNVAPKCLKIVKAIRKSFPYHLGIVNSYVYKNAILLLLKQEEDWTEEALAERFVDVFKVLETSFSTQKMNHWYCPEHNLLSHFNPSLLEFMGQSIREVLRSGQYDGLFQIPE